MILLVGRALGANSYQAAKTLLSLSSEDFVQSRTDAAKVLVSELAAVNLSSLQLVRNAFSDGTLSPLSASLRTAVSAAAGVNLLESEVLECIFKKESLSWRTLHPVVQARKWCWTHEDARSKSKRLLCSLDEA